MKKVGLGSRGEWVEKAGAREQKNRRKRESILLEGGQMKEGVNQKDSVGGGERT